MSEALAEPTEIDQWERELLRFPEVIAPFANVFTPGLYLRAILMPAGTGLSSRIHKSDHPFIILKGKIAVKSETEEIVYQAPYIGVTPAGTRRALVALEDTVWVTTHANPDNCTDPDAMVEMLTDDPKNPLFDDHAAPRLNAWKMENNGAALVISDEMKRLTNSHP